MPYGGNDMTAGDRYVVDVGLRRPILSETPSPFDAGKLYVKLGGLVREYPEGFWRKADDPNTVYRFGKPWPIHTWTENGPARGA